MPTPPKLTPEEMAALRAKGGELAEVRNILEKLKRIGTIDVSEHEERLNTVAQTREGLLREFGNPMPGGR